MRWCSCGWFPMPHPGGVLGLSKKGLRTCFFPLLDHKTSELKFYGKSRMNSFVWWWARAHWDVYALRSPANVFLGSGRFNVSHENQKKSLWIVFLIFPKRLRLKSVDKISIFSLPLAVDKFLLSTNLHWKTIKESFWLKEKL